MHLWLILSSIFVLLILIYTRLYAYQLLWLWMTLREKYRYKAQAAGDVLLARRSCVIICSELSWWLPALLRRHIDKPIYMVATPPRSLGVLRKLLKLSRIHVATPAQIPSLQGQGILIVSEADFAPHLSQCKVPIILAYVCGLKHMKSKELKWSRQAFYIHLSKYTQAQEPLILRQRLNYVGVEAWQAYANMLPSITELWLSRARRGGTRLSVADSTGVSLSHHRLIVGVMSLREQLDIPLSAQTRVAICLPPSVGACTVILSLLSLGKTLVPLNYTASIPALQGAIQEAGIRIILTSHLFVQTLKKKGFDLTSVFKQVKIIYLEDIRRHISRLSLLKNLCLVKLLPYEKIKERLITPVQLDDVAVILFSSGSEGVPKGVMLTHKNILCNCKQSAESMESTPQDVMIGLLPVFHAFGLTGTTLLPLIEGISLVCHPDPRDAVAIGRLVQQYRGTIMCGTSTFYRLYVKSRGLTKDMLASLRYVVAGAERLLPEVRQMFKEKFDLDLYEGYGTTELSPIVSLNRPDLKLQTRQKMGSIGQTIPGCVARIIDPETHEDLAPGIAGMLTIGGPNVMKGYLNQPSKTDAVIFEQDHLRWYMTGDKAVLEEHGFITLVDRYSRFAKLGGEMVSLSAVESAISEAIQPLEIELLAVAVPDLKKGEEIIVMFAGDCEVSDLEKAIQSSSMNNLMKPAECIKVPEIPKLGSGKTDFSAGKKLAISLYTKSE